jgi:hypothetical protein
MISELNSLPQANKLSIIRIVILLFATVTAFAQEIAIVQHSSFCEGNAGLGGPGSYRERIKDVGRKDGANYSFTAVLIRDCDQPIFPVEAIKKDDTLFVTTSQIETATFNLANGKQVKQLYSEEECRCAYEFRVEVALDTVSTISIDGRILEKTEERLVTQPIRYFIFNGDTTGYDDRYGRRQGAYVIKRKNDLLKSIYKDGVQLSCELLSLDGKLIRKEKDCHSFTVTNRK